MSTYKVKKGDSWWKIAKNNNIDIKELMQLNNANEKTSIHPGQEIKLKKEQTKLVPRANIQVQQETPSDNTRVKKPVLTKRPLNVETTEQNWVEQAQAYRQTNPTIVQAAPEQPYQTNYWAFTGNTPAEQFSYQVMQNVKKNMQDAEKAVKSEKVKHTLYKGDPARTKQEGDKKDQIANLQRQLRQLGYYTKTVDGIEGNETRNALAKAQQDGYELKNNFLFKKKQKSKEQSSNNQTLNTIKQIGTNFLRDPSGAAIDIMLHTADRMGAPTNATNYLRDLNVSIPYRIKNAVHAGINTLVGDKSFSENYNGLLANPGLYTDLTTIRPLSNTNSNFSNEELQVVRDMAGNDFKINNADIKKVSEDGKYGGKGHISKYFTPTKVVQTAIGQSGGNANDKQITDLFDVNTVGETAKHDNQMYINMAKENPGFNYETMRATMPYLNMIDIMPNKYKIKTRITYEN